MYDKYIFREICVFRKRSIVDRYDSTGHVCYIPQLVLRSRVVYKKKLFSELFGHFMPNCEENFPPGFRG